VSIIKVRKMTNTSNVVVPIKTSYSVTVGLPPGEVMENVEVYNLELVQRFLEVEQDLTEVNPIQETRRVLND